MERCLDLECRIFNVKQIRKNELKVQKKREDGSWKEKDGELMKGERVQVRESTSFGQPSFSSFPSQLPQYHQFKLYVFFMVSSNATDNIFSSGKCQFLLRKYPADSLTSIDAETRGLPFRL